jgi:putative FmdB family regulatory protein
MPTYNFECKKCKTFFEEICSFADYESNFKGVQCPECKSKSLHKNVINGSPGAVFANPRQSSKWDNWSYRQGKTWEEAKMQRAAAESANRGRNPYRTIDDTDRGRRMNFID